MIGWIIFGIILVFLISAIPLNLAVHVMGGRTNIIKTALIALLAGIIVSLIEGLWRSTIGAIVAFIVMIWIYREAFKLQWIKALLAWLLQFVFIVLFGFLFVFALGILGVALVL